MHQVDQVAVQRVAATLLTLTMPQYSADALTAFFAAPIREGKKRAKQSGGEAGEATRGGRAAQARSHRKAFGDCWSALLSLPGWGRSPFLFMAQHLCKIWRKEYAR